MLAALQGFEPAGLFARDLAECLKIQLIENNQFSPLFGQLLDLSLIHISEPTRPYWPRYKGLSLLVCSPAIWPSV